MPKLTLLAEKCWIIRMVVIKPNTTNIITTQFMETRRIWNISPAHATIFQSMESAEHAIYDYEQYYRDLTKAGKYKGRADGGEEILYVVSMYDEMLNGPYGSVIEIKDGKVIKKDRS